MQTREQMKNWKVVASVATVAALGVSGLAIANPGDATSTPPPIEIEDRRPNQDATFTSTTQSRFEIVPGPSVSPGDDDSLDTPLASAGLDSPDPVDSPADSPADSPDPVDSPADSPDPVDSPADSPDPVDSPADSPADSPDVADSGDSPDSADSLDS